MCDKTIILVKIKTLLDTCSVFALCNTLNICVFDLKSVLNCFADSYTVHYFQVLEIEHTAYKTLTN